jgi:hypothetical protein
MSEPLNRAGRHVLGTELLHKSKPEPVRRMEVFLGRIKPHSFCHSLANSRSVALSP